MHTRRETARIDWKREAPDTLEAFALGAPLGDYVVLTHRLAESALPADLSPAEREVAQGILDGLTNAAIASRRKVSVRTIANQVASIFRRLGVGSRAEIVRRCVVHGPIAARRAR
jgi:DNA-binding NarL/FixJ family response regulator